MKVPPVGRIWVVLGGFLPGAEAVLPAGTVPRLVPKMVLGASGDGGPIVSPSGLEGGIVPKLLAEGEIRDEHLAALGHGGILNAARVRTLEQEPVNEPVR